MSNFQCAPVAASALCAPWAATGWFATNGSRSLDDSVRFLLPRGGYRPLGCTFGPETPAAAALQFSQTFFCNSVILGPSVLQGDGNGWWTRLDCMNQRPRTARICRSSCQSFVDSLRAAFDDPAVCPPDTPGARRVPGAPETRTLAELRQQTVDRYAQQCASDAFSSNGNDCIVSVDADRRCGLSSLAQFNELCPSTSPQTRSRTIPVKPPCCSLPEPPFNPGPPAPPRASASPTASATASAAGSSSTQSGSSATATVSPDAAQGGKGPNGPGPGDRDTDRGNTNPTRDWCQQTVGMPCGYAAALLGVSIAIALSLVGFMAVAFGQVWRRIDDDKSRRWMNGPDTRPPRRNIGLDLGLDSTSSPLSQTATVVFRSSRDLDNGSNRNHGSSDDDEDAAVRSRLPGARPAAIAREDFFGHANPKDANPNTATAAGPPKTVAWSAFLQEEQRRQTPAASAPHAPHAPRSVVIPRRSDRSLGRAAQPAQPAQPPPPLQSPSAQSQSIPTSSRQDTQLKPQKTLVESLARPATPYDLLQDLLGSSKDDDENNGQLTSSSSSSSSASFSSIRPSEAASNIDCYSTRTNQSLMSMIQSKPAAASTALVTSAHAAPRPHGLQLPRCNQIPPHTLPQRIEISPRSPHSLHAHQNQSPVRLQPDADSAHAARQPLTLPRRLLRANPRGGSPSSPLSPQSPQSPQSAPTVSTQLHQHPAHSATQPMPRLMTTEPSRSALPRWHDDRVHHGTDAKTTDRARPARPGYAAPPHA
ncbi:hypothetical protein BC831DRAFT_460041 [Entophlyctis helioformis]|nr:hypothetical protein BC831DRAFT_460041 [Entophlyctis helioformis]